MNRIVWAFLITVSFAMTGFAQKALNKADMQFEMRAFTSAIQSYSEVLEDDPDNQYVYAQIARCHVYLQDNLQAAQWFEKIIDRKDVIPGYYLEYGDLLKSLRLYAKAKFYYQKYGVHDIQVANHFVQSCDIARAEVQGKEAYEVTPLTSNSPSSEFAPSVYRNALVFSSFREEPAGRTAKNGAVTLETQTGLFTTALVGTSGANAFTASGYDGNASNVRYSADGKYVAFHQQAISAGQRLIDDRPGKVSLYTGEVDGNGAWSNIKPFPFNSNEFATGYPHLASDGNVLYFASTRPGGYGGWDLYVSFRSADGWSAPQNLGPVVNTQGHEISPCASEGLLYFSSDWHTNIGGFDVFKASGSNGQWTAVRPMGYPVNSPKDDLDFFWDQESKTGYFTSNRIGGRGQYDLYTSRSLFDELHFIVKDQATHQPLKGAMIRYKSGEGIPIYTGTDGSAIVHQYDDGGDELVITLKGFKELPMKVRTGNNVPRKYEVFIDREVVAVAEPATVEETDYVSTKSTTTPEPADETPTSGNTTAQSKRVENTPATVTTSAPVKEETKEVTPAQPVNRPAAKPAGKYAVQVAALGHSVSLAKYADLEMYGNVMQYPEGSYYKIRIGYFDSQERANAALQNIRTRGYPDAFIVRAIPGTEAETTGNSSAEEEHERYKVRLATYSRPGSFDSAKVDHLGRIETYRKNDLTIMLLSGYTSLEQAQNACNAARGFGFVDAFVVEDINGQLLRVRED